jgi:methionine-rich copper-binding protein CopC
VLNLKLELSERAIFNLEIFDTAGRRVHYETLDLSAGSTQMRIENLGNLQNGVYICSLSNKDGRLAQKIIKE